MKVLSNTRLIESMKKGRGEGVRRDSLGMKLPARCQIVCEQTDTELMFFLPPNSSCSVSHCPDSVS